MATNCVTTHEAEEMCDCLCVYRSWMAVRDLDTEEAKELSREYYLFPIDVRREAERMSR